MRYTSALHRAIREYILDIYDSIEYDIDKYNLISTDKANEGNFEKVCESILHIFFLEKVQYDKRNMTYKEYFTEWCQGLPSIIDTCYYYNRDPNEDLKKISESARETTKARERSEAEQLLTDLIYEEINRTVFVPAYIAELKLQAKR